MKKMIILTSIQRNVNSNQNRDCFLPIKLERISFFKWIHIAGKEVVQGAPSCAPCWGRHVFFPWCLFFKLPQNRPMQLHLPARNSQRALFMICSPRVYWAPITCQAYEALCLVGATWNLIPNAKWSQIKREVGGQSLGGLEKEEIYRKLRGKRIR